MERQESSENSCTVCHEHVSVWAVGPCDHPVCYKCLTRMRVLCKQLYCAICRSDLSQVLFVTRVKKYSEHERQQFKPIWKTNIFFESDEVHQMFIKLLAHSCSFCPNREPEPTFQALKVHMRQQHQRFCCDLCVKHLQLFTSERKFYSRKDLATHRRIGDPDDTSYKGHPLCEFCDDRYMDKDELHRHLRKDHYFCHFCDAHGTNEYYNDYADLREHFRIDHYLCEEGECEGGHVQFTNAFNTEIDLKAHCAQTHSRNMSKAQIKEVRTLDIDIQMPRRRKPHERGMISGEDYSYPGSRGGRNARPRHERPTQQQDRDRDQLERALEDSLKESLKNSEREMRKVERIRRQAEQEDEVRRLRAEQAQQAQQGVQDFPTLSNTRPEERTTLKPQQPSQAVAFKPKQNAGVLSTDDYPSLSSAVTNSVRIRDNARSGVATVNSSTQSISAKTVPQSRAKGGVNSTVQVKQPVEDFPELGRPSSASSAGIVSLGAWSGKAQKQGQAEFSNKSQIRSRGVQNITIKVQNVKESVSNSNSVTSVCETVNEDPYPQLTKPGTVSTEWVKIPKSAKNKKNWNIKSGQTLEPVSKAYLDKDLPLNSADEAKPKTKKKKKKLKDKTPDSVVQNSIDKNKQNVNDHTNSVKDSSTESNAFGTKNKMLVVEKSVEVDSGYSETSSGSLDGITGELLEEKMRKYRHQESIEELEAVETVPKFATGRPLNIKNKFDILNAEDMMEETPVTASRSTSKTSLSSNDFPKLNPSHAPEEFPTLKSRAPGEFPTMKSPIAMAAPLKKTAPPPGLGHIKSAPPGFKTPASERPPPGFTLGTFLEETMKPKPLVTFLEETMKPKPLVTFLEETMKPKPLVTAMDYENFDYFKPANFSERNKKLVEEVSNLLEDDHELFNQFKSYSGQFRQGSMSAAEYYKSCQELFGDDKFNKIVGELISLLPDIRKQQELLSVHTQAVKSSTTKVLMIGAKSKAAAWESDVSFLTCGTCRQVLVQKDYDEHVAQHEISDFPTLATSASPSKFVGQASCIRAK